MKWIISAGANIMEATQLSNDLSCLQTSLPKSRLLIYRAEWSRFKNKELVVLLSRLKDITYDAEDILREFGDQLPQLRLEDTNRSWALQLVSSSFNLFKNWISGSKRRVLEAQTKLDIVVNGMEGALNLMGIIDTDLMQHMPETSSVIGVPEVMGREEERDLVIEMLGLMTAHDNNHDQVMELLHMPVPRYSRSAGGIVKKRKLGRGVTSASFGPVCLSFFLISSRKR